jgi:sirohydrochlorin ferrochelatase
MKALLVIAHGSRRAASNDEVRDLTQKLASMAGDRFGYVDAAFLELAEPLIPDGILAALDAGAEQVVVLPYFLSAGRHVAHDIPEEVEKAREMRPDADIRVVPYAGSSAAMLNLLLDLTEVSAVA